MTLVTEVESEDFLHSALLHHSSEGPLQLSLPDPRTQSASKLSPRMLISHRVYN